MFINKRGAMNKRELALKEQDLQGVGVHDNLTLMAFVCLCSGALNIPVQESQAVLGGMTIGGTISRVVNLADALQVCHDAGAKRIILPAVNAADISSVPSELFSKFQINFYSDPEDAVRKALGRV